MKPFPYRNKRTGDTYFYLDTVFNATNGEGNKKMVLYKNENGLLFVRNWREFFEKFEGVKVQP